VVAHLLDLLTPELLRGTPAFVASCQTYEGGFSSASQPYYGADADGGKTLLADIRPSLGEAHGGYTFCALASWIMLRPYLDLLSESQPRPTWGNNLSIDYRRLLRWLVQMQGSEIELGGFRGRTNKLVDGCYSWWVGGCFALLASQGVGGGGGHAHDAGAQAQDTTTPVSGDGEWDDDVDGEFLSFACAMPVLILIARAESVWNKPALQRYILCAAQHPAAGLRDKPPKYDPYLPIPCE
jgi:protein farnesyltransferase subunit beta